jgi:hypothetical protein
MVAVLLRRANSSLKESYLKSGRGSKKSKNGKKGKKVFFAFFASRAPSRSLCSERLC